MTEIDLLVIEKQLLSSDKRTAIDALLYACFNIKDADWMQEWCAALIMNSNIRDLQGLAITCIGHTARIHGKIDEKKITAALQFALNVPELAGRVNDALDDIEIFTGLTIKP